MKKPLKAVLCLLAAAIALAGIGLSLNRIAYGRSIQATIYEWKLRRRNAHPRTVEAETDWLEARRAAGETPYALPQGLQFHVDVAESESNGLRVFTLNSGGDGPIVLYLHGGAYVHEFNAYQWRFMDRLARASNCKIVAPAYHLAPYGDYARACEDLRGLWRGLVTDNPGRPILLMGDSAGGGLALALGETLVRDGEALPERLILFSPWVDISMDNPDIQKYIPVEPILHYDLVKLHGQYWAGQGDVHDWQASPLFGGMAGLPPVTMYCGTRELLYPDILLMHNALLSAGVDADLKIGRGLNHDYPLMPLPEADRAFREVAALVSGAQ